MHGDGNLWCHAVNLLCTGDVVAEHLVGPDFRENVARGHATRHSAVSIAQGGNPDRKMHLERRGALRAPANVSRHAIVPQ